jgi:hypothetical protein
MHNPISAKHFSKKTLKALASKGVRLLGLTMIPGDGDLPYASGSTGYNVSDNGTHRVLTFRQVLDLA